VRSITKVRATAGMRSVATVTVAAFYVVFRTSSFARERLVLLPVWRPDSHGHENHVLDGVPIAHEKGTYLPTHCTTTV